MVQVLSLLVTGFFLLATTFVILLALPNSRLREVAMPIILWTFVALSGAYVLSPVDLVPEIVLGPLGVIDDLGVGAAGIGAAITALRSSKQSEKTAA